MTAAINIVMDPGGIYRDGKVTPEAFADALVASDHGLWWPDGSYDERALKKALASHSSEADCVVVGSSHVMQVGSRRTNASLRDECTSILNLGVSGAGIEDHLALAYLALRTGPPKKIVLGVAPWTFAFGKDQRWTQYKDDYYKALRTILDKDVMPDARTEDGFAKIRNLFSLEYTIRSVRKGMQDVQNPQSTIAGAPEVDETVGGSHPILLPDGSLVYSSDSIANAAKANIPIGGERYKTDGALNQDHAIRTYRALLAWVRNQGVEPILLLTPYHENVWIKPDARIPLALRESERIARHLARELDIKVIGSYDPQIGGCDRSEFIDFMHPTTRCLAKLKVN